MSDGPRSERVRKRVPAVMGWGADRGEAMAQGRSGGGGAEAAVMVTSQDGSVDAGGSTATQYG